MPFRWSGRSTQASVILAFEAYEELVAHAATLLPSGAKIVLLGDRAFRTTDLMRWCQTHRWSFRLCLQADQLVTLRGSCPQAFAQLRLRRSMVRFLHAVTLGGQHYGPLHIAMA